MGPSSATSPSISRDRLGALLTAAAGKRVTIVGDAMLDVYLRGDVERISPEAPVPVVRVQERRYALGGAANVAQNVAAVGARARLIAAVGSDVEGAKLRGLLRSVAEGSDHLIDVDRHTTTKTRVIARAQQLVRVDEEDDTDLDAGAVKRLLVVVREAIDNADALVLEDYNKGVLLAEVIEQSIGWARGRKLPVVVDPKYRNFFRYRGATIFKPNRRELEAALGAAIDVDDPRARPEMFARLGVDHLLLTLGERGMALLSPNGEMLRVPTMAREVYDVVGAGDTVTAYLATMLAAGATVTEAALIANIAAGVEVGKLGAATVTPDEVLTSYDGLTERAIRPART